LITRSLNLNEVNNQDGPGRHFDVLVFSDFRFPGGTSTGIAAAVRCLGRVGYNVGMIHVASSVFSTNRPFHPEIVDAIQSGHVHLVPHNSQPLQAGLALFLNPLVFRTPLNIPFQIQAEKAVLVLSQPVANALGEPYYDLKAALDHCQRTAHTEVIIAPMSAVCRDNLQAYFPGAENVFDQDWTDIIDVEGLAVDRRRFRAEIPVIGRHSRPGDEKWPATAEDMLAAYPARDDVRVRILGAGPRINELVGSPPSNWELFHFGDLDVHYFLSSIDFWVYFHNPAWVESFGRAIAEAMASGAVTMLPHHFEKSFSDGAIYCQPAEVTDIVNHLYSHPKEYQTWSRRARRVIERDYGEHRYIQRVEDLIGSPESARKDGEITGGAAPEADSKPHPLQKHAPQGPGPEQLQFEVVYLGDFCSNDEDWPRVADELALLRRHKINTGIVHLPLSAAGGNVNANLVAQVHDGAGNPVNPMRSVIDTHSVVLTTSTLEQILVKRPVHHVFADQVVLLCDDLLSTETWLQKLIHLQQQATELYGGSCLFSAVRPGMFRRLQSVEHLLPVAPQWDISTAQTTDSGLRRRLREIAPHLPWCVGVLSDCGKTLSDDPGIIDADLTSLDDGWRVWWYGCSTGQPSLTQQNWVSIGRSEMTVERFLSKIDVMAVLPTGNRRLASHTAVWKALHAGLPVILPESWREDFGPGPLYRHSTEFIDTLKKLAERPDFRQEILTHVGVQIDRRNAQSSDGELKVVETLAGHIIPKPARVTSPRTGRVLFMSSNGVGVGHLSRLLAIARRLPDQLEPVFLSLSQALPVVRQFGFHGEFLPYHLSTLSDYDDWNGWLEVTLAQILDAYSVDTVVFDGSMPYSGLCRAVSTRNDCRMVWIRRGMWRPDQDNTVHLSRARFADLIIEPDDIAAVLDSGKAAEYRNEVVVVDPIRVLDPNELLSRKESCTTLGLNQRKRYALIQLGAGNNFSNVDVIDQIIGTLREIGSVQPVIAEWLTAETPLDLWPEVPRLRGYPISRYYRAFDFTVSAVGYNSFNEIISFGLPSVLVPNLNQMMDDQSARALFADSHDAAIHVNAELRPMLREVIAAIHDDGIRKDMVRNCRKLARPNGAREAAGIVAEIAGIAGDTR